MRYINRKRLKTNKHGFTLAELVVVMAIMAICSGMLVGVISSTIDRYSASTQIETRKQEAISFEEYYSRYARSAFTINVDPDYGTSSFTIQDNTYYLVFSPTNQTMTFFTGDESGGRVNIITCNNIKSYQHHTEYVDKDKNKNALVYEITMENQFDDTYSGTIILNNGSGINLPNTAYISSIMTSDVCFAFRVAP